MQTKNAELMNAMLEYIDRVYGEYGKVPSVREIAAQFGISKSCVSNYIAAMRDRGMIESAGGWRDICTPNMKKRRQGVEYIPVVGSVACGTPMLAEQNIESYLPIPVELLGAGEHFILKAYGDSMVNAGIDDGDMVLVRKQETAEEGRVIVALIDGEATLKRYFLDEERKCIRLHPENDEMEDMYFAEIAVQGIAEKVIKDID